MNQGLTHKETILFCTILILNHFVYCLINFVSVNGADMVNSLRHFFSRSTRKKGIINAGEKYILGVMHLTQDLEPC